LCVMQQRTNIVLDMDLVKEAQRLAGIGTMREVVHEALRFFIRARKRRSLLDLDGKVRFHSGFDVRKLRREDD